MSQPAKAPPPVSFDAMNNASRQWTEEFGRRFRPELEQAVREYEYSILGGVPFGEGDIEQLRQKRSSLPAIWAAFWRPMADGSTGGALAAKNKKLGSGVLGAAVARMRAARVLYGDVTRLEGEVATVRDLVRGDVVRLRLKAPMPSVTPRHLRLLGVAVDRGEGPLEHPSVVLGNVSFTHVSLDQLVSRLVAEVRELGHDPRHDGDAGATLLRWVGVAHGLARRLGAESEKGAEAVERDMRSHGVFDGVRTQAEALARVEALLDQRVEWLSGAPRALVGEPGGPEKVEAWLWALEQRGIDGPVVYVDLDPVRRSLGLPVS